MNLKEVLDKACGLNHAPDKKKKKDEKKKETKPTEEK